MATYELHFTTRDEDGNEHNGGEPVGVDSMDEAVNECVTRCADGEIFEADHKVGVVKANGDWNWL